MKTLFFLLLLVPPLYLDAQPSIGWTKKEAIKELYSDPNILNIDTVHRQDGVFLIICSRKNTKVVANTYAFGEFDNICSVISTYYHYSELNSVITFLNNNYVKESEYKWIDYGSKIGNFYIEIAKEEKYFLMYFYLKH